ncbi:MAG: hypothetical protein VX152_12210, partial [Pseudomonadota bacterium]|nr:hypothetical protein [Pseudomonadota bacterium]
MARLGAAARLAASTQSYNEDLKRLSSEVARLRHELGAGDEVAIKMTLRLLAALVPTSVLAPEAVLGLLSCIVENGAAAALRAAADAGREAR